MSVYDQVLIPDQMSRYCVQPHWDANAIFRYSVPQNELISLPVPPRPYSKICLEYKTSAEFLPAPPAPADMVFLGANERYPPNRYIENVDNESKLERLDRPLMKDQDPTNFPEVGSYVPSADSDMFTQRFLLNPLRPIENPILSELTMPKVARDIRGYECRNKELACDLSANPKIWFNATKLEKYNMKTGPCAERYDYVNGMPMSSTNLPRS